MSHPQDDEDDGKRPWLHPGDLGTILLAGVFLVAMLFMIFGPSPFEGVFKNRPQAQQPGVVDVTVPSKD